MKRMLDAGRLCFGLCLCAWVCASSAQADDEALAAYRTHLYTAREDVIRGLEDAVARDGSRIECCVALIHALDVNSEADFADRAARQALKRFPGHPELLIARAKVVEPPTAFDILTELGKQPSQRQRSRKLLELLRLALLYSDGQATTAEQEAGTLAEVATRMLDQGMFDRVPQVVEEGLRLHASHPRLANLAPFALALDERFDEAMRLHAKGGSRQTPVGKFRGLADCLLWKGQPERAIASFGDQVPEDAQQRRLLAVAHAALGRYDRAEEMLGQSAVDDLLRIRFDLRRGREDAVRKRAPDLLSRHCTRGIGSWAPPRYADAGGTLGREYGDAIFWLEQHLTGEDQAIEAAFGHSDPQKWFRIAWQPPVEITQSAQRYIAWLRDAIPASETEHQVAMRQVLARLLADDHQFEAAQRTLAPNAVIPVSPYQAESGWLQADAVQWSLLRRRAELERHYQKDPASVTRARQLLQEMRCRRWNCGRLRRIPWRDDQEVARDLKQLPSEITALLLDDLQPNTMTGDDHSLLVEVLEPWVEREDAPVLIAALRMSTLEEPLPAGVSEAQREKVRRSGDALHRCLLKLTGEDAPAELQGMARARYWSGWWRRNSDQIVMAPAP